MILGDRIEGGERIPVANDRPDSPVLIVGRDHAYDTLERLFLDDVHAGFGANFFGNSKAILKKIPRGRLQNTILIELDYDHPRTFNPLAQVPDEERSAIAEYVVDAFAAAWPSDIPTTLLDNNLLAASLAMLSIPSGTLYAARHLFTSSAYRTKVMGQLKDVDLRNTWELFDALEEREQRQQAQSILNRLIPLTSDPWYRNIIAQTKSLRLKKTDIVIVDLPATRKGKLLAALLMARLNGRVYIQSPHVFVGGGLPIVACQYLDQLPDKLRTEMIGTATLVAFRLGVNDAKLLTPEFDLRPQGYKLGELPARKAYVRLDETVLTTVPENEYPNFATHAAKIRNRSRSEYSVARGVIEKKITTFIENV